MRFEILFFIIMLSMIFCSCTKNSGVDDIPSNDKILFDGVECVEQTRSSNYSWEDGSLVGIFAHYGNGAFSGDFMSNIIINSTSIGGWEYKNNNERRYWPSTATIDFVAYYPYNSSVTLKSGIVSTSFSTVAMDSNGGTPDLMWSVITDASRDNPSGDGSNGSKTKFRFKHALAQIVFKVKNSAYKENDSFSSNVLGVALSDVYKTSILKINPDEDPASVSWDHDNAVIHDSSDKYIAFKGDKKITSTLPVLLSNVYMIPSSNKDKQFDLTYSINDANSLVKTFIINDDWLVGKKYTYTFDITFNTISVTKVPMTEISQENILGE